MAHVRPGTDLPAGTGRARLARALAAAIRRRTRRLDRRRFTS